MKIAYRSQKKVLSSVFKNYNQIVFKIHVFLAVNLFNKIKEKAIKKVCICKTSSAFSVVG